MTEPLPQRFRVGAYGLLREADRVLVTRTRTRLGALLNFPGGAVELGEGTTAAVRREFLEETGTAVAVGALAYVTEGYHRSEAYPENQLVKIYWSVERVGPQLPWPAGNGDDVEACLWLTVAELLAPGLVPSLTASDREMVQGLRDRGVW